MEQHRSYIRRLVEQGGPNEPDYKEFTEWVNKIYSLLSLGQISSTDLADIRLCFGTALSASTMQGFALNKPHGYAGDYEVIERIYQRYVSPDPNLAKWDHYYHQQAAPEAVRNRKTYFHQVLDRHHARIRPLRILNVASGPGRCMYEWLCARPNAAAFFHCIEIDPDAIKHATALNHEFVDRITFTQKNALRYRPREKYDVVWAAGLFDYFTDAIFLSLLERLVSALAPGGELVIGNFSDGNPSRAYMELIGDWQLHHRSAEQLRALAVKAGIAAERVQIGTEPMGVNLFLHITI